MFFSALPQKAGIGQTFFQFYPKYFWIFEDLSITFNTSVLCHYSFLLVW